MILLLAKSILDGNLLRNNLQPKTRHLLETLVFQSLASTHKPNLLPQSALHYKFHSPNNLTDNQLLILHQTKPSYKSGLGCTICKVSNNTCNLLPLSFERALISRLKSQLQWYLIQTPMSFTLELGKGELVSKLGNETSVAQNISDYASKNLCCT